MDCVLPDEIVSEILSPALKISDEIFSDNTSTSPFASSGLSTSAYLLVCKAWLRVATPLLYNVVVLRSKAQAEALAAALKLNPDLGSFIKKFRVEGGYGIALRNILKASPNITDLVVTLAIWSSDAVSGLCQSLSLINPVRLIIYDAGGAGDNKQNLQLTQTVVECIKVWNKLKIVDIPYTSRGTISNMNRCNKICQALKAAPLVEEIIIPFHSIMEMSPYIHEIRKNPALKRLTVKEPVPWDWAIDVQAMVDSDPILKNLVQFSISEFDRPPEITPSSNPAFTPLEFAPQEIQDKIWSLIFYFAFDVDALENGLASDINTLPSGGPHPEPVEREIADIDVMLVSKQFKRLSLPYFYRNIPLLCHGDFGRFANTLIEAPSLGKHVMALAVSQNAVLAETAFSPSVWYQSYDWDWDKVQETPPEAEEQLLAILPLLDGLVSLTGAFYNPAAYPPQPQSYHDPLSLPWTAFQALGSAAGATLRRLCVHVVHPVGPQSPLALEPFRALRSLEWKSLVEFNLETVPVLTPAALANLECISLVEYHPSFLDVLAAAELPSLRRLFFHTAVAQSADGLLERHGRKLTELVIVNTDPGDVNVLDACPELPLLFCCVHTMDEDFALPSPKLFTPKQPHRRLTKIVLDPLISSRKSEQTMTKFIRALDSTLLPALREIQVFQLYWPTTEREIAKSLWIGSAEYLLAKDIKLTDGHGRHWTPRLKFKAGGRR
ncbi:hypothetical protein C8R46DRAFT_1122897 [Mycena filopes]|nr:hypothetical protein C8R46DRAFT_1122897 [Mycena filopes]